MSQADRAGGVSLAAIRAEVARAQCSKRPQRTRLAVLGERALETTIRLSGMSAIFFVLAIFFFNFREAAPILFSPDFDIVQFLFSPEWYRTSLSTVRYGTLALSIGTLSVTAVAIGG